MDRNQADDIKNVNAKRYPFKGVLEFFDNILVKSITSKGDINLNGNLKINGDLEVDGKKVLTEYVLYNTIGSAATIILSDSVVNYSYIEIFYKLGTTNSVIGSKKVYLPNNSYVDLFSSDLAGDNTTLQSFTGIYNIVGNSIALFKGIYMYVTNTGGVGTSIGTNYINILRVVGYK